MNIGYSKLIEFEYGFEPRACCDSESSQQSDYYSEDEEGSGSVHGLQIQNPFEASPIFIVSKKRSRSCLSSPSASDDGRLVTGDSDAHVSANALCVETSIPSYWSTIATSQERDQLIIQEILANPKDTQATFEKLSKLFGWSVEAVQVRWKALNPNRCQGGSFSPQKTSFRRFLPMSPRKTVSAKRPRVDNNNRSSTRFTGTILTEPLSETDRDALLIRSVSSTVSMASPVDWKHLASVFNFSVEDMKTYYKCMNVSQRIDELILHRVRTNNQRNTDSFWNSIERELNIHKAEDRWKRIAISAQVCVSCGRQPCWCAARDASIEYSASSHTDNLPAIAVVSYVRSSSASDSSSSNTSTSTRSSSTYEVSNLWDFEFTQITEEKVSYGRSLLQPRVSQFLQGDFVWDRTTVAGPIKKEIIVIDLTDE